MIYWLRGPYWFVSQLFLDFIFNKHSVTKIVTVYTSLRHMKHIPTRPCGCLPMPSVGAFELLCAKCNYCFHLSKNMNVIRRLTYGRMITGDHIWGHFRYLFVCLFISKYKKIVLESWLSCPGPIFSQRHTWWKYKEVNLHDKITVSFHTVSCQTWIPWQHCLAVKERWSRPSHLTSSVRTVGSS